MDTQSVDSKPPKVLDHLRVMKADNGGHVVEHHFTSYAHEPEKHVFSKSEGSKTIAHITKHAQIKPSSLTQAVTNA